MSFVVARRFAVLGLVLCLTFLCTCVTGARGRRQPGEGIGVPFLVERGGFVWDIGHSAEDQAQRITEFVRPGQTIENWTELVTQQTFNKAYDLGSIDDHIATHQRELVARCPGTTVEVVRRTSDGVLYESHVVNCEQGADEHVLARVLDGTWNRFVVQYSVRREVTMTPQRRKEWIEKLMDVRIINLP